MSEILRQRIRFTGKRTGMDAMFILGFGIVSKGQTIELEAELAERWAELLPAADDKTASDWTLVGEKFSRTAEEAQEADWKQQERLIEHTSPQVATTPAEDVKPAFEPRPTSHESSNDSPKGHSR